MSDTLLTPTATPVTATPVRTVRPRTDIFETEEALIVVADVPGAASDSVELVLEDDVLTLKARNVQAAPDGWQPVGAELRLPDYERTFRLTAEIEREGIQASLENGRLRVVLSKRRRRASRIEVRAS